MIPHLKFVKVTFLGNHVTILKQNLTYSVGLFDMA